MATTAVPAEPPPQDAPAGKGKKKLILIAAAAAVALLLTGGGVAAFLMMKKDADVAEEAEVADAEPVEHKPKKKEEKKTAPVFLPLEMFTVNLADRDAERYAQVGVTLEVADAKTSDTLKAYMPVIRNDILMLIAHKKAAELQERDGKLDLAREIRRAAMKPLDSDEESAEDAPVRAVHFSSFIIQ